LTEPSLTQGKLLGPLFRLALPFLAGNIFSILVLAVDRIWIGQVGTESLAALGMAHAVLMICVNSIMGPAIGTLAGVSRSIGSGDSANAAKYFVQGMIIAVLVGAGLLVGAFFIPTPIMAFMDAGADVTGPATDYLKISMMGLIVHAPLFVLTFAIQGAGDAKTALKIQMVSPLVNAILDPILIFGLGWGLVGAAWATVAANLLALVLGIAFLLRTPLRDATRGISLGFDWSIAKRVLVVGVPGTLEQLVRTTALFLLVRILAPFGAPVLAAYTTTIMVIMVLIFPGLALGQATATLMGQNLGAGFPGRAWKTAWVSVGIFVSFMVVAGAVIYAFAEVCVAVFDSNPAVVSEGATLLRAMVLAFPTLAMAVVLSKAFGGAGKTVPPMISSTLAHLVFQVSAAFFWSQTYGVVGAYWAIASAFVVHGILNLGLFVYFLRPSRLTEASTH
jgi:putative MATE family efflux protein